MDRLAKTARKNVFPKSPTGIKGLDEITGGGIPKGRPTLVTGPAGSGKTLMAMEQAPKSGVEIFEKAAGGSKKAGYVLRLYIAGASAKSSRAVENMKRICEEHLHGRYDLEVIDIYQKPVLAAGEQIIAAPTLIKKLPPPLRRFIGDMTDVEKVLVGLDVEPKDKETA